MDPHDPRDPRQTASQAFNALDVQLKTVLFHTGSALSNASGSDDTKLLSTRTQLEKTLPDSLKRWHVALDELEHILTTAKATLHRDLAALKSSKLPQEQKSSEQPSPAWSLDSDAVMVEAPTDSKSDAFGSAAVNGQPMTPQETFPLPTDEAQASEAGGPGPDKPTTPQDGPQVQGPEQQKPTSPPTTAQDADHSLKQTTPHTGAPLPPIESGTPGIGFDGPINNSANADVGALLPGLLDYANDDSGGNSDANANNDGMNLDDFSADHLFTNPPLADPASALETGRGESLDDLFAENGFGDGDAEDASFNQDGAMNFETDFNFDDLIAQGDTGNIEGDKSTSFDPSFFDADFFNLDGTGTDG